MKININKIFSVMLLITLIAAAISGCAPASPAQNATSGTEASPVTTEIKPTEAVASTEAAAPPQPATEIRRGGTLLWGDGTLANEPDLRFSTARADAIMMASVVEGLIRYNRGSTDVEPALADSWKVSDDNLTYTFHLRPGVKFSDGSDITVQDCVFSIKQIGEVGVWKWLVENVESVEAPDAENVQIKLKTVQPGFLNIFAMIQFAVYPEKALGAAADSKVWFKSPITAGPFYIKDFVSQDHITLAKNPYYWELGADGKPLPYLDEIKLSQVPEDTTRVMQVRSGSLNGSQDVPYSMLKELQADKTGAFKLHILPAQQTYYLWVNNTVPPFDDVKVRQALSVAIDRDALVEAVTAGAGSPAYTYISENGMCFDKTIKVDYDVEKAKKLISESKYPDGYDGAKIYVPAGRLIGIDIATFVQAMWKEVGINTEVQQIEPALLATMFNKNKRGVAGDHQIIAGFQWTNQMLDPSQQTAWMCTFPATNSGYDNPVMWDLVDKAYKEVDPAKRCELYSQIQRLWSDDQISIPLFYSVSRVITSAKVKDYYANTLAWHDFKHTWLTE